MPKTLIFDERIIEKAILIFQRLTIVPWPIGCSPTKILPVKTLRLWVKKNRLPLVVLVLAITRKVHWTICLIIYLSVIVPTVRVVLLPKIHIQYIILDPHHRFEPPFPFQRIARAMVLNIRPKTQQIFNFTTVRFMHTANLLAVANKKFFYQ
jgi:hypothetical protein